MQSPTQTYHLDPITAQAFLEKLPEHIKQALLARAAEIDYPIEAVLESAISFAGAAGNRLIPRSRCS